MSTALGMLDSSDSPCVWVFRFLLFLFFQIQILGTVNNVRISSSYFIEHSTPATVEGAGAQQGHIKTPAYHIQ